MTSNIKSFTVGHTPFNKVYTSGDYLTGEVALELSSDCKVDSLSVKLKGKAEVTWTECHGKTTVTYHNKEKYFSLKQFLVQRDQGNETISAGCHVYPFNFQIPAQDLPSSFTGSKGTIQYTLEAVLSRPMRMNNKAKAFLSFVSRNSRNYDPLLMNPQQDMFDKKLKLFASGSVSMDVNIPQKGFHQGQGIKVVASIFNKSTHNVKPKYCLYQKHSFFAKGKRRVETKDILKEVGEAIPPSAGLTVTKIITIPPDTCVSVSNCNIIKAEYRLRVYLDVKYAFDPEVKFPIVILPALQESDEEKSAVCPPYGFDDFANMQGGPGFAFPQNPTASNPPPPYGTYGIYPSLSDYPGKF